MYRIAVDLDGTILRYKTDEAYDVEENTLPYGTFGEMVEGVKEALQELKELGAEIVVVTNRIELAMINSYLKNTLHLPIDRIVSQSNNLGYDFHIGAGCVPFRGNWSKALADLREMVTHGTWEERRRKGQVTRGIPTEHKGYI